MDRLDSSWTEPVSPHRLFSQLALLRACVGNGYDILSTDDAQSHAARVGYEVAAGNSAFILQKLLLQRDRENSEAVTVSGNLLLRQLILSCELGNAESQSKLGNLYLSDYQRLGIRSETARRVGFDRRSGMDKRAAIYRYSKASGMGHALANLYLGFVYHYGKPLGEAAMRGTGTETETATQSPSDHNLKRAKMYYKTAMNDEALPISFRLLARWMHRLVDTVIAAEGSDSTTSSSMSTRVAMAVNTLIGYAVEWYTQT